MKSIDRDLAHDVAVFWLQKIASQNGESLAIASGRTKEIAKGWVFFYNTEEFLKTGNPLSALAGNGPLLVLRNGQVKVLPTSLPWQEAVQNIDASTDGRAV